MVKVRDESPRLVDGTIDIEAWLTRVENARVTDVARLRLACDIAQTYGHELLMNNGQPAFDHGLHMAELLAQLHAEEDILVTAILAPVVFYKGVDIQTCEERLGKPISEMLKGFLQMSVSHTLFDQDGVRKGAFGQQNENLRKMLLAMVEDVRVVLIKLAECVCNMRLVKFLPDAEKRQLALEVREIYAPLANRLGIGQLKWELEDLSFRALQPDEYKKIAKLLDEKRLARETYIRQIISILEGSLKEAGITAEVHGRAKHIYSIWRKMRRKRLDYSEIYDVRAVRILVDEVKDCYGALGIVHSLWAHIPREFDDYIATPKENGYQSLHTAVIGPERKSLEVQIRTHQMHQESELGVAAHWRYKEAIKHKGSSINDKVAWLRQVLDWQAELFDTNEFVKELKSQGFDDRVYVFTPKGDAVELVRGATPLDFAYQIHTDIGHRCRGAKVNGRIVPLTYRLKTGEQVAILTSKEGEPSRDWLNPSLGYLKSTRARAKVHAWFKQQDYDNNLTEGRYQLEREMQRLDLRSIDMDQLAEKFNFKKAEDLYAGIGRGDLRLLQVVNTAQEMIAEPASHTADEDEASLIKPRKHDPEKTSGITVGGEKNVLTKIAGCCKPVPGDQVIGYITKGRGITIHRADCVNVFETDELAHERLIQVQWNTESADVYPLDIYILAYDRQGLLRDITRMLANEKINVIGLNTVSNKEENFAEIIMTIEVSNIKLLSRVLAKLGQIPNIFEARRY